MASRKRVGLVFSYNESWIAGAYYILNIIHALKTVSDEKKPTIVILTETNENFLKVKNATQYPYLEFHPFPVKVKVSILKRVLNKLNKIVHGKQFISKKKNLIKLDFLYPKEISSIQGNIPKVNWIPDFQEEYLPQYFSEQEIARRKALQKHVIAQGDVVVLSSEDAKSDFTRLYPNANAKTFVLPFAVTHPDFDSENIDALLTKYNLPKDYFFAPNQFWAHKNHIVVFKAVNQLKKEGVHITVALSGKEDDHRNKDNFNKLKHYITKHELESNIIFLGFLPREEQLCLFQHAIAIVQPSLFEGWSTVVEDAKALGKYLIVSNLGVHKEQIKDKDKASFFNPNDNIQLAHILKELSIENPGPIKVDYNRNVDGFGIKIIDLINFTLSS